MVKIYRVIQINLNQFVYENVHVITSLIIYQQRVLKHCHRDKHFSEFCLQDGGKNQLA